MPKSPAKPWLTGYNHDEYCISRWLVVFPLLLVFLMTWSVIVTAAEADQSRWQELLQRQFSEQHDLARLVVEDARLQEKNGRVELSLTLRQQQETPLPLAIPLLISTPRQVFSTTLSSRQAETTFTLELTDRPTEIRLDPYQELPRQLDPAETPPTWAGFMAAQRRLAVIPEEVPAAWEPLLEELTRLGIEPLPLSQIEATDMAAASLMFVNSDQESPAQGFFATPPYSGPDHRIDLTARENPINPDHPAILLNLNTEPATAALQALLAALDSPGLFSRLQIDNGTRRQEITPPAQRGLLVPLDQPPDGIAAPARRGFHDIMTELADTRVIYVGEVHNRYEDHLLQLRVLRAMYQQNPKVAVAMEMFPTSVQPVIDAYVAGDIDEPEFLRQSDYFTHWSFDYRLYREIIDFARAHALPIVALNLERGITSKVFSEGGVAALSGEELALVPADRDLALPGFRQRIGSAFAMHDNDSEEDLERFSGFLQAQSLWDEQMAARMAEFLQNNPEHRLLAVVGQGHSDKINAIPPRLARRLPVTQKVILPVREQPAPSAAADYFFFTQPQSLPDQPLLGVRIRDHEETAGALVAGLSPHGKARGAGIQEGDLIIALNEWEITGANDLRIAMLYQQAGQTVNVRVLRPLTVEEEDQTQDDPPSYETQEFVLEL
ncbi:ChaN family lipoprotein [Desulfurivibrio dismutans]|uniref:ChaN family lipoprotein n=1 Tax=Desulfurivibrio dismutans TaxID=1398908 RepID=UPI0023DCD1D2|nr:ChaN family lipoprotein [Desulfurivibrio alkaliphilus]MDF1614603.1 ChaN family lipoprotein [Desulfurivibrio alkaliphilus]